ncbi:agglutinin biogenesis protein MshI [Herbaspirillum sp. GCM10030257]|uniref:agglutinin biogenesis protein MshI n=1 Tax=Herbaspirillum sp. GCM10030257 TaxID=3273393 RepID=UPI00361E2285
MAVSLHADGICAVHVVRPPNGKPRVESAVFEPLENLSVADALDKLGKGLSLSHYHCSTLLGPREYQMLSVEAPSVPPEELKAAIRWRIKDMLDFHIDDATIDVLDVPTDKNSSSRTHTMYAVAARNNVIQTRQDLLGGVKIPLSVIDIPDMAQRNISALLEPEGRGVAFLSFDAEGGLLTVTYSGELYLTRRIDVSLSQLQQTYGDDRVACHERITLELQRSLDHFERQYQFVTVTRLFLAPLGEGGESLRNYLSTNLYIPVENVDLGSIVDITKIPDLGSAQSQQRYFMTLGAALRHEEKTL